MELVGTDLALASSAILARSKHSFVSVVSRRLTCRCLLLLLLTAWEWSHLSSPNTPHLKQVNSDHEGQRRNDSHRLAASKYAEKGPTNKALLRIFAAPVYAGLPRLLYAVAVSHAPAGKESEHRLPMFFEDTPRVVFLLRDWYTERPWSYALCCVATMLLALISVLLKRARRMLENVLLQKTVSELIPGPAGSPQYTSEKRHVSTPNNAVVNASTTIHAFSPAKGAESQAPPAGAEEALNLPHAETDVVWWKGSTGEAFALWGHVSEPGFASDEKSHFPVLVGTTADAGTESCQGGNLNNPQAATNRRMHSDQSESIFQADTCNRESYRATTSIQKTKPYGFGAQSLVEEFPLGPNAARAVAAFFNYSIDYLLMLLAMMFNVGILLSLLTGVAIGFLLIGHHLAPPSTQTHFKCSTHTIHSSNAGRTTETRATWGTSSGRKSGLPTREDSTESARADNSHTGMQEGDNGTQALQSSSLLFAKQSTGDSSAVQSVDPHDDIYCCSYTGMARGVLPEDQGGTSQAVNRGDKKACGRPQDRSCPSAARRCCDNSGFEKLCGGHTGTAATYPCTSAAAQTEAGAAGTGACMHGILPQIAVSQPTSPGEDVACAGQEAALQLEESSATYKSIDVRSDSSRNRSSGGRENGLSEGENKNRLEERMDMPSSLTSPSGEGIEYCLASVRLPPAGRGNQHAHISQRIDLQRPHLLSPRETEFERRPSDCYDMLAVADNIKKLYPADSVTAAPKTHE